MNVKLVSYDVWSTLVRANKTYKEQRVELMATATGTTAEAAKTAMSEADDRLDQATIDTGRQFGFAERVQLTAELLGCPPLTERELVVLYGGMSDAFRRNLPTLTEPNLPQVLETLKQRGYAIAVNSNTGFVTADLMRAMLLSVGIGRYIDYGLFSDEIGAAKPSPEVFAVLEQRSGFRGAQILHIGDNLMTDVEGARLAGMQSQWYNPKGTYIADAMTSHDAVLTRLTGVVGSEATEVVKPE